MIDPTRTATFRNASYVEFVKRWKIVSLRLRARIENNPGELTESTVDDYETYLRALVRQEFRDQDKWLFSLVLTSYIKGIKSATRDLRKQQYEVPDDVETDEDAAKSFVFSNPKHRKQFLLLLRRTIAEVESLKEYIIQQTMIALIDTANGNDYAKLIAASVVGIAAKSSKSKIFGTVIRAFANATLITFLLNGIREVINQSEVTIQTAGDNRVCSRCRSFEGNRYTISEAMNLIPFHDFCRCKWIPVRAA